MNNDLRERQIRKDANRQTGEVCYAAAYDSVLEKMQAIGGLLGNAPDPGNGPDWCHAASMNYVADRLAEILEFMGGE